jgi:hypothetical protein
VLSLTLIALMIALRLRHSSPSPEAP